MHLLTRWSAHPLCLIITLSITVLWLCVGTLEQWDATWLLWLCTIETLSVFFMGFIIQHTKNHFNSQIVQFLTNGTEPTLHQQETPAHDMTTSAVQSHFIRFTLYVSAICGSPYTFVVCVLLVGGWAALGVALQWSDIWLLILSTATSVIMLSLIFIVQCAEVTEQREILRDLQAVRDRLRTQPSADVTGSMNSKSGVFDQFCSSSATVLGHYVSLTLAVASVAIWVAYGNSMGWNNQWWLIVNTYTDIATYITLFPLHNTECRRRAFLLQYIARQVQPLSAQNMRRLSIDIDAMNIQRSSAVLQYFHLLSHRVNDLVGKPFSLILAILSIVAWAISGPYLQWSDSWLLIIDNYTMTAQTLLFILLQCSMLQSSEQLSYLLRQVAATNAAPSKDVEAGHQQIG